MTNQHPTTGIAFGYIRADSIDSDLWQQLCDSHGTDVNYALDLADHLAQKRREHEDHGDFPDEEFDEDEAKQAFADEYQCDEPIYEGEHEGVKYRTSWMGGAPCLRVFESPVVTLCRPCSPCVPGAGDLDSVGDYEAYGVPVGWLTDDFLEQQCISASFEFSPGDAPWYWRMTDDDSMNGGPFSEKTATLADCYEKNLQRKLNTPLKGNEGNDDQLNGVLPTGVGQ